MRLNCSVCGWSVPKSRIYPYETYSEEVSNVLGFASVTLYLCVDCYRKVVPLWDRMWSDYNVAKL